MTKFFLWILGENINEQLDLSVKILFNTMMLGLSLFFVMNVTGLFFVFYTVVRMFV